MHDCSTCSQYMAVFVVNACRHCMLSVHDVSTCSQCMLSLHELSACCHCMFSVCVVRTAHVNACRNQWQVRSSDPKGSSQIKL